MCKRMKLCVVLVCCLLLGLSACENSSGTVDFGGVGLSDTALVELDVPMTGPDIRVQLSDKDYSRREIQSAIGCYQSSSSTRAHALAKTYIKLLNDAVENQDTLETAYYSVASQIKQEQQTLELSCL